MKRFLTSLAALMLAPALAHAQPAGYVTLTTPPDSQGLTCYRGQIYSLVSAPGVPPYVYAPGGSSCNGSTTSSSGGGHATNPLTDGPNSVQFMSARTALDLESIDVEGAARFDDQGDSDTIGGAATYFNARGVDGEHLEGRYERNWRPFEGSRTRAIVNLPGSVIVDNNGQAAVNALLSGGLEIPVQPNWSVTPRAGLGGSVGTKFFGGDGVLGTVSVGSRYRFPQVGRGDLVLGNLISYTGDTLLGRQNVLFRNGLAYQFPLKQMMFGRQVSARVSYVNTYIAGDPVGINDYHELAVNFGVRMRGQDVRSRFELLRFGVLYTHADNYNAGTLTVGYRF